MRAKRRRTGILAACALVAAALFVATPAAAAGSTPQAVAAPPSLPLAHQGEARAADQGMRLDRSSRVLDATAYQTLTVVGVASGAMLIGAFAAGAPGALSGGAAVVLMYMFMR